MKSEKVTDIFGNEKVVHYDDYGNKVGESQVERGFLGFGEERVVHYDANGNKTGESRQEKDFFGNDKVVHYDDYGIKTGESRQENGFLGLGEDRTVHYDDRGHKVSQTFTEKDFFGNEKQVTYDRYGVEKIGEYRDNTPHYGSCESSGSGSSVDYSGYHEVHVPTLTAKDAAWLLSTLVLTVLAVAIPFILYIASKNIGGAINLIRTAVTALCPVATLFSIIMYRAKKTDGDAVCRNCYRFASVAFAVISGAMELTNVISEGTLDDVLDVIILFIPAMAILCGAIYALTAATNWIYKKLAG